MKSNRKKWGTMDKILLIIGIALFAFTICMIVIFVVCGSVPDALIASVFASLGGECGVMGWIKTCKERNREREWEKEERNKDLERESEGKIDE